jgi:ribonuclease E
MEPSYKMVTVPEAEAAYTAREQKPAAPEAMVKGITPGQPAPVVAPQAAVAPAAEPSGLIGRILGWFKKTEQPVAAPAAQPKREARKPGARRERGERERGERGERRERPARPAREGRRTEQPEAAIARPQESKQQEAREKPARQPKPQRQPKGEQPPQAESQRQPTQAGEAAPREGGRRRGRGGRGERGERRERTQQPVQAETNIAPTALPEPVIEAVEPTPAPAPVPVAAPAPITPQEMESAAVAPAPLPVNAPSEPIEPVYSGVTAKPEEILKNLGGEAGLNQVETQIAAPAPAEGESAASSGRRPRRRRPQAAAPQQMELMQVETSAPAAPAAPTEDTSPRSHGPGRRRHTSGQAVANEPLVQVETQH